MGKDRNSSPSRWVNIRDNIISKKRMKHPPNEERITNPMKINTVSHNIPNRLEINNTYTVYLKLMLGMAPDSRPWEV